MYRCKNCGSDRIVERVQGIKRDAEIAAISIDNGLQFKNPKLDFSKVEFVGYFCLHCDISIVDTNDANENLIRSEKDLIEFIKREYKK